MTQAPYQESMGYFSKGYRLSCMFQIYKGYEPIEMGRNMEDNVMKHDAIPTRIPTLAYVDIFVSKM